MSNGRRKRPSIGFVAFCTTYILVAVFFIWGFATPDLDRVWTLHHLLKIGEIEQLDKKDEILLDAAMKRHPKLTEALLGGNKIGIVSSHMEGWISTPTATLLRTSKAKDYPAITVDVMTPEDLLPFEIDVRANDWNKQLKITSHGQFKIDLPSSGNQPEIIEVFLRGQEFAADQSLLGVRLIFEESK